MDVNPRLAAAALALALLLGTTACGKSSAQPPAPAQGHPRLLIRESDVARLRSWASPRNPMYAKGLRVLAGEAKAAMDAGHVPDDDKGSDAYDEYTTEAFSELFAFMSLMARSWGVMRARSGVMTRPLNRRRISAAVTAIGPPWRAWCQGSAAGAGAAAAQAIKNARASMASVANRCQPVQVRTW